jgi:DNA-3-methyladenine glycosylase
MWYDIIGERQATMHAYTQVLPAAFYDRNPVVVAQALLGKLLVHRSAHDLVVGRIVETEAYLATYDPASHAYSRRTQCYRRTPRNAAMFGPPGHAYVYQTRHHHCLNVVTEGEGVPSAVLVRAVEPLAGIPAMQRRRATPDLLRVTSGPGRLCQAFGITGALDRHDLTRGDPLWVAEPDTPSRFTVTVTPRIGVTVAREFLLRFTVTANPFVSRRRTRT